MIIMPVNVWDDFKTLVSNKNMLMQYSQSPSYYEIFAIEENAFAWNISLLIGSSDATDFENNYKTNANQPLNNPTSTFFNTSTTSTLKSGKGKLHRIIYSRTGGLGNTQWTIYDNTAGSGTIIHQCALSANADSTLLEFNVKFVTGLTIVTGSANHNITVIWE